MACMLTSAYKNVFSLHIKKYIYYLLRTFTCRVKFLVNDISTVLLPSYFGLSRATLSIITFNGYFQEYIVNINNQNESKWTLEREFNLLPAISGTTK